MCGYPLELDDMGVCPNCGFDLAEMEETMQCPHCGQYIEKDIGGDFPDECPACGESLHEDASYVPPKRPWAAAAAPKKAAAGKQTSFAFCPNCGSRLQDAAFKFCPYCGFDLSAYTSGSYKKCPHCGELVEKKADGTYPATCSICGYPLDGNGHSQAAQAAAAAETPAAKPARTLDHCPNCASPLNGSYTTCPYCGFDLLSYAGGSHKTCPYCGAQVEKNRDGTYPASCPICGYAFGEETVAGEAAYVAPGAEPQAAAAPSRPAVTAQAGTVADEDEGTEAFAYIMTGIVIIAFIILEIVLAVKGGIATAVVCFIVLLVLLNFHLTKLSLGWLVLMVLLAFHS